jgi:hypothetical protein
MCRMFCEHGFVKGADGCDTCACNPGPRVANHCISFRTCRRVCANGFKKAPNGCDICSCA